MLKQATVADVSSLRVTRRHGYIVVVTHYYPRFLKKKLIDEYLRVLAPSKDLLHEYKVKEAVLKGQHDQAFEDVDYENKFTLVPAAFDHLQRLSGMAEARDVYLVCHCQIGQRCHREILLALAKDHFQARISRLHFDWRRVRERYQGDSLSKN